MKHINLPFIVFFAQSIIWSINSNLSSNTIAKPYNDDLSNNSDSITLFEWKSEVREEANNDLFFYDQRPDVKRYKEVILTDIYSIINHTAVLQLPLFENAQYNATIEKNYIHSNGSIGFQAVINGLPYASFLFSSTGQRSLGIINLPSENTQYKIISCPNTHKHYVLELVLSELDELPEKDHLLPPPPSNSVIREQQKIQEKIMKRNLGPNDIANIDVMVVYTYAAKTWANNSGGGIENVVALAMEQAVLSHNNSETLIKMNLVYSAEVPYAESGSSTDDLINLTNGTGQLAVVHDWRDEYGADLVAMFTDVQDTGGLAWLLNTTEGRPDIAFSITRVQQATGLTHAHEMGHNMGCHHHKEQNFQPGPGLFSYSAGWRWTGEDFNYYCDLMTYSSGSYFSDGINHVNVPFFSNPNIAYQNEPTGDAFDGDNARTLKEIKHVIAAYRESTAPPEEITGDVNSDGTVNLLDVIMLVNHIIGNNPSGFNADAADVNSDGVIDINDVVETINIILHIKIKKHKN